MLLPLLQNNLLAPAPAGDAAVAPFARVTVDFLSLGGARVSWELSRHFKDPDPPGWLFTLQASRHGRLPTLAADGRVRPDDWEDVAGPVEDACELVDPSRRAFGKALLVAYRVALDTPAGRYHSDPATTLGALGKKDWVLAREIARREALLHRKATSQDGYLLRRRRLGTPCPKCLDPVTKEVTLSRCDVCRGVGWVDGYFPPVPAVFCRLEPPRTREHRDDDRGSSMDAVTKGRVLAVPGMSSQDAWADAHSDLRYHAHLTGVLAQVRGVPVVLEVELRQAPYSDPVYQVDLSYPAG